jgi:putative hydrolase of the HAD superfamily
LKAIVPNIKSIIFDLGGVLLNLDYNLTVKAFETIGITDSEQLFSKKSQTTFFDDFETGKISAIEFRTEIRQIISQSISDEQIDNAWNAMLLDFPTERFDFLKKISKSHRIFLLSNTNEIHMSWFKNYINQLFGENVFFHLFEVAYLSNEMGMRKPHKEIFDFVVTQNNLNPINTLFIDDSPQHLVGAKKAGLHTIWLEAGMETIDIINQQLQ